MDDELLTARAQKEELGAKMIESAFAKVEKWADENCMIFDPDKFEAIYFSRRKAFHAEKLFLIQRSDFRSLYCQDTIFQNELLDQ